MTGAPIKLTEDTTGGTAPQPEATDATDEATPETAVAVTTADEPATSPPAPRRREQLLERRRK